MRSSGLLEIGDGVLRRLSASSANGAERPAPRWSKSAMRQNDGSKYRRWCGRQPPPGPPCRKTSGTPLGLPQVSQYSVCRASTLIRPAA
jgi:hypothetical protein